MTFQFVPKRKLLEFEKILIQEEVILRSILSVITNDKEEDIGVALMNIYWSNNQDVAVMEKTCVPVELERTPEEVQLFRQNSSYLFMLSEFLRLNGGEYMKKVLRPAIKHFLKKDSVHYEIDPKRIDAPENMAKHINNVTGASQFFLDTILKAVHDMPLPLREFIRRLFAASEHRFPGSGYRSIGALYFLRFVCPMIVSPKAYQLVKENKELTPAAYRGLILVAKVIQSVANESTSFEKEEYMKPLTELVMRNVPGVHSYYDAIIKEEQPKGPKISSRSSCPPQYLLMIVRYLRRDAEKVRSHTLEQGGTEAMWTKLMGLVEALSPTPSKSGKLGTPTGEQAVLAAASSGGGENEHVAVQATGSSPSVTDLQSSDENLSDRQELSRSVSPPNLRPLIASSGAPAAPMSPSKKIKKDEKDKKDKGAKIKKDKPDKNAADKRAKKPDAVEPASSPSNSPIARHPGIIRSNSNVAATASGGTTTSGGGESSDSTEDPRSSHSDQFALP